MNISPKEIKKKDFKKSIRGYDIDEVDAFLETLSSHYEKLLIENKNLSQKIAELISDIEVYKENELNLQKAIIKSQELGDEIIINAKKRAELIIKEAELNATKIKQDVENDIINKKQELDELKNKNDKLLEDLRIFLNDKLIELEEFIRHKKVFKMELTTSEDFESNNFINEENIVQEQKPLKKVTINNQFDNNEPSSFKDSFEVK